MQGLLNIKYLFIPQCIKLPKSMQIRKHFPSNFRYFVLLLNHSNKTESIKKIPNRISNFIMEFCS